MHVALVKSFARAQTHTQREKTHLKLQKGVVLVPCLILEALASLFPPYRLSHHQCCYGSQSDPKHCKFIFIYGTTHLLSKLLFPLLI